MRVYPDGSLASQLVGHQGDYGEAFGGVEASYDDALKRGKDVDLTMDSAVQQELQKALATAVEKSKAKSAVGVVMRVDDGAIVALANTPAYDNNSFDEVPPEDQRDRVLTDPYEPGSTFKAFTVASALEEGAVTPDRQVRRPGSHDRGRPRDQRLPAARDRDPDPGRRARALQQCRGDEDRPGARREEALRLHPRFRLRQADRRRPVG